LRWRQEELPSSADEPVAISAVGSLNAGAP
jgi:hypothetical protein